MGTAGGRSRLPDRKRAIDLAFKGSGMAAVVFLFSALVRWDLLLLLLAILFAAAAVGCFMLAELWLTMEE